MRNRPPSEWSNSPFGRLMLTLVGVVFVLAGLSVLIVGDGAPGPRIAIGASLVVVGALMVVSVWTARLNVQGDRLVAKNFYGSRSISLSKVVTAEPVIIGLIFRTDDGTRVRSLVSGRSFDELWKTRAEKICEQVLRLAHETRPRHDV